MKEIYGQSLQTGYTQEKNKYNINLLKDTIQLTMLVQ